MRRPRGVECAPRATVVHSCILGKEGRAGEEQGELEEQGEGGGERRQNESGERSR